MRQLGTDRKAKPSPMAQSALTAQLRALADAKNTIKSAKRDIEANRLSGIDQFLLAFIREGRANCSRLGGSVSDSDELIANYLAMALSSLLDDQQTLELITDRLLAVEG